MAVDNNVSINNSSILQQHNNTIRQRQYKINPNVVDKTPNKDTVQLSTAQKAGIGAGVALATAGIIAAVLTRKTDYIAKAQKTFQETFMRSNISREETIKMLNEYKDIKNIENIDDYITALFNNAKKNYGLEHLNFSWKKVDAKELPSNSIAGSMDAKGTLLINKNKKLNRDELFNVIFHEFRHAKQNEMMCSTDAIKYSRGLLGREETSVPILRNQYKDFLESTKNILKRQGANLSEKQLDEVAMRVLIGKLVPGMKSQVVDGLGYGKSVVPDEYKDYVAKCFEGHRKYTTSNLIKYYFNFLERDARKAGEGMKKLLKSIPDVLGE